MRSGFGGKYDEQQFIKLLEISKEMYDKTPFDTPQTVRSFRNAIRVGHAKTAATILRVLGARVTENPNGFFYVKPSISEVKHLSINGALLGDGILIKSPQPIGTILYGSTTGTLVSESFPKGISATGTLIADQNIIVVLPITGSIQAS